MSAAYPSLVMALSGFIWARRTCRGGSKNFHLGRPVKGPPGVVYVGQNFVWVGQARVWVGRGLPGLIARTASADLQSLDFTFNCFYMKLFKSWNIELVKDCQRYSGIDLPSSEPTYDKVRSLSHVISIRPIFSAFLYFLFAFLY